MHFLPADRFNSTPMPLAEGAQPEAVPLHGELANRILGSSGTVDSWMYNGGTLASLLASGAAGVVAGRDLSPTLAAALSAAATFFLAASRMLDFPGRWKWHLRRRGRYAGLIYRLNASAHLDRADQLKVISEIYDKLGRERAQDGQVPGSGEAPTGSPDEADDPEGPTADDPEGRTAP